MPKNIAAKEFIRNGRAPIPSNPQVSRVMSAIRGKDTKPELILRKALWAAGLRGYRLHWRQVPGKPDIAYPGKMLAIFIHGCFWHRCPKCDLPLPKSNRKFWEEKFANNIRRDEKKIKDLRDLGWTPLVMRECEIKNNIQACVDRVHVNIHNVSLS